MFTSAFLLVFDLPLTQSPPECLACGLPSLVALWWCAALGGESACHGIRDRYWQAFTFLALLALPLIRRALLSKFRGHWFSGLATSCRPELWRTLLDAASAKTLGGLRLEISDQCQVQAAEPSCGAALSPFMQSDNLF
jgi:hypothetical protein